MRPVDEPDDDPPVDRVWEALVVVLAGLAVFDVVVVLYAVLYAG